jgi:hypothetical protein
MNVVVEVLFIIVLINTLNLSTGTATLVWAIYIVTKLFSWFLTSVITVLLGIIKEALKDN